MEKMNGKVNGYPVARRLIIIAVLDIVIGLLSIGLQSGVTFLSNTFLPLPLFFPHRYPNNDILRLGLASSGVWIGVVLLLTGIVGVISAARRKQLPVRPVGSSPASAYYSGALSIFLCFTIVSIILSIVLICIAGVLSGHWLDYLLNPPVVHPIVKSKAAALVGLNLSLTLCGLIALIINSIGCFLTRRAIIWNSRTSGPISFRSGATNGNSNIAYTTDRTYKTIEVVTRPASQVAITTVYDTGSELSTPALPHVISRNPSFNSAIQHKTLSRNHSFNSAILKSPEQSSNNWSYDF